MIVRHWSAVSVLAVGVLVGACSSDPVAEPAPVVTVTETVTDQPAEPSGPVDPSESALPAASTGLRAETREACTFEALTDGSRLVRSVADLAEIRERDDQGFDVSVDYADLASWAAESAGEVSRCATAIVAEPSVAESVGAAADLLDEAFTRLVAAIDEDDLERLREFSARVLTDLSVAISRLAEAVSVN